MQTDIVTTLQVIQLLLALLTEKFQLIIFDKERQPRTLQLNHNVTIQSVSNVKLLGVNIDVELNFNHHIALLCNKTGRQINALSRLSNVLNVDTKILILQSFIVTFHVLLYNMAFLQY